MCLLASVACAAPHRAAVARRPSPPPCHEAHPPCPPVRAPINLASQEMHAGAGLVLDPPPGSAPAISADLSVDVAWQHAVEGALGATAIQPIYATYSSLNASTPEAEPVWVVLFVGSCQLLYGGPSAGSCIDQPLSSVINAQTGEWLFAFSD